MSWLAPLIVSKGRRPGYWRDYYAANIETRRQYLAAQMRKYRAKRRAAK